MADGTAPSKQKGRVDRAERLRQALRANLKRRKSAAKAADKGDAPNPPTATAKPTTNRE